MSKPLPQATRDRIVELAASGMPRNQIATEVGVSAGVVTKYVHAAGGSFDRQSTAAATEAASLDDAARRQKLAADLLTDIERDAAALRQMKPKDLREAEQLFRARASAARAFADITRAAPPRGADVAGEVRNALVEFRRSLLDRFGEDDAYGRVPDEGSDDDAGQVGAAPSCE